MIARLLLVAALLTPTAAWSAPATSEDKVAKQLKEAEREGFQRRDLAIFFGPYTKQTRWTFGRRPVADEHDYTLTNATYRAQLAGRWEKGASGQERVFFRELEVKLDGPTGAAEAKLVRHFFGGSEHLGRSYELALIKDRYRVTAVRTWTLKSAFGVVTRIYDDAYLLDADAQAAAAMADPSQPFLDRISALVAAGWLAKAYAIAQAESRRDPKTGTGWRACAQLGFTLGHIKDAKRAAKRLRAIDPTAQLAPGL